ncbi:unnamed protein product, partial [Hapterophycus canaliculatus]
LAGIWKPDAVYEITLLNRSYLRVDTDERNLPGIDGTGRDIGEGDQMIVNGSTAVTFEYDSGYVLQLGQPLAIEVDSAVGSAGVRFGDTFSLLSLKPLAINDDQPVVFELVMTGGTATAGNIAVEVDAGDSAMEVMQAVLDAMIDPNNLVD